MKIKTKLSDYKTTTIEIEVDGKAVDLEVRSISSRDFEIAKGEYLSLLKHAKDNEIPLTESVPIDAGLGLKGEKEVATEFANKSMAVLLSSLVVEWPFDEDLKEVIFDNPELGNLIDLEASKLSTEFAKQKKT
jgi:hypothetical protein